MDVVNDVIAEGGRKQTQSLEASGPLRSRLLAFLNLGWIVTGEKIDHLPRAGSLQHQTLVASSRKTLFQALEQDEIVTKRLAEARHEIWRHQVHLVLHYRYYLELRQTQPHSMFLLLANFRTVATKGEKNPVLIVQRDFFKFCCKSRHILREEVTCHHIKTRYEFPLLARTSQDSLKNLLFRLICSQIWVISFLDSPPSTFLTLFGKKKKKRPARFTLLNLMSSAIIEDLNTNDLELRTCVPRVPNTINYIFSPHLQLSNGMWMSMHLPVRNNALYQWLSIRLLWP